jgi:hypothetical protein
MNISILQKVSFLLYQEEGESIKSRTKKHYRLQEMRFWSI